MSDGKNPGEGTDEIKEQAFRVDSVTVLEAIQDAPHTTNGEITTVKLDDAAAQVLRNKLQLGETGVLGAKGGNGLQVLDSSGKLIAAMSTREMSDAIAAMDSKKGAPADTTEAIDGSELTMGPDGKVNKAGKPLAIAAGAAVVGGTLLTAWQLKKALNSEPDADEIAARNAQAHNKAVPVRVSPYNPDAEETDSDDLEKGPDSNLEKSIDSLADTLSDERVQIEFGDPPQEIPRSEVPEDLLKIAEEFKARTGQELKFFPGANGNPEAGLTQDKKDDMIKAAKEQIKGEYTFADWLHNWGIHIVWALTVLGALKIYFKDAVPNLPLEADKRKDRLEKLEEREAEAYGAWQAAITAAEQASNALREHKDLYGADLEASQAFQALSEEGQKSEIATRKDLAGTARSAAHSAQTAEGRHVAAERLLTTFQSSGQLKATSFSEKSRQALERNKRVLAFAGIFIMLGGLALHGQITAGQGRDLAKETAAELKAKSDIAKVEREAAQARLETARLEAEARKAAAGGGGVIIKKPDLDD